MRNINIKRAFQLGLTWWGTWQERSVNHRIFAAMVTVGGFTVLVKLAAVAKEIAVAYNFGRSDELDAYLIAFLLPQFAINLIAGSLNAALIPTYIQVQEQEGQRAAQRLISSVMVLSAGFLVALSVVLALTASYIIPIVASGFAPEKLAVAQTMYYGLLATLVLSGLATTWGAILNAQNHFALVGVVPMTTSIVTVLLVVAMAQHWGGYTLVAGTIGGALIETGLLGWGLTRAGVSIVPRWCGISPAVKQVSRQYAPMVAASFLMGSAGVISQAMAATLGPGSVSALAYGNKITTLLLGVGALAVSTAVLPHFSRMVAREDWVGLKHTLVTYSCWLLIVTLPFTLVLIYYSEPATALLFQRGAFTEADTHMVGLLQAILLVQVPLSTVAIMFVRLISAFKANRLMLWGNAINLSVCIVSTYVLMQRFEVVGIAVATCLVCIISTSFLMCVSLRLIKLKTA